MKKWLHLFFVAVILVVSGLSACNLEEPACTDMPASWAVPWYQSILLHEDQPGTQVTFHWYYPGTCVPDRFLIIMNDIPFIDEEVVYEEYVPIERGTYARTVFDDGTSAISFSWTTEETFLDGPYWWWVIPYSGFYAGERSSASEIDIITRYGDRSCTADRWHLEVVPEPAYPANGSTIHTLAPTLYWRDRNPQLTRCHMFFSSDYIVLYSQDTHSWDFAEIDLSQPEGVDLFNFYHAEEWVLPPGIFHSSPPTPYHWFNRSANIILTECKRTYWQVYLRFLQSNLSTYVVWPSEVFYFDVDPALCEGDTPFELFPPPQEIVMEPPLAKNLEDANCRAGPSMDYPLMSILPGGGEYEIQGRNQDGTYWLVFDPAISKACWVFADLVETLGDTSGVDEVDAGPPPTKVPTAVPTVDCSQYNTNPQACAANPACYWDPNYPPNSNGSCRNK